MHLGVKNLIVCDSKGAINSKRKNLIEYSKKEYYYGSFWIFGIMFIILAFCAYKFDKQQDNIKANSKSTS